LIIIKHAENMVTIYAHNKENLVKEGDRVARGQVIANVGQTGRADGPHLHFEVRQKDRPKNPLFYLP
jgi:murein DD-endopeptidase MepM/ murein hydrolase activator NlpD